jgi:hypothetical protein
MLPKCRHMRTRLSQLWFNFAPLELNAMSPFMKKPNTSYSFPSLTINVAIKFKQNFVLKNIVLQVRKYALFQHTLKNYICRFCSFELLGFDDMPPLNFVP